MQEKEGIRVSDTKLQKLDVLHCEVLRFFATEFQNSPDSHLEDRNSFPTDQQESVSLRKVISSFLFCAYAFII